MNKKPSIATRISRRIRRQFAKPPQISNELTAICKSIKEKRLTFLGDLPLASLVSLIVEAERKQIDGCVIEAGCALGGSAIAMASGKSPERTMKLYDTFEIIPPPTERDGQDVHDRYEVIKSGKAEGFGDDPYYGYIPDKLKKVQSSFVEFGLPPESNKVEFFKGLLQDTMVIDQPVAIAHIDVDWYDPVLFCLEKITPHLSLGGAIVLDDYFAWSGCREATDDFLKSVSKKLFSKCDLNGHLILRKRK